MAGWRKTSRIHHAGLVPGNGANLDMPYAALLHGTSCFFFSGRYIVASPATAADVDANSIAIRGAGVFGEEKRCMHRRGWTKGKIDRYSLTASRVHPVVMGKVLRQTACRIERVDQVYLCGR